MIKAIETIYNGYRFRSRLEARWAVVFDALGIEWVYEPEGLDLGKLGWYLPDFYLPGEKWFVEVKGLLENDEQGIKRARYLDNYPPRGVMGCLIFTDLEYAIYDRESGDFNNGFLKYQLITPLDRSLTIRDFNLAITYAKQARFEHGEKPIIKRKDVKHV